MKLLTVLAVMLFAGCSTPKKINKPGMYQITGIVKTTPGETAVQFNKQKKWYRIYSAAGSDTLKLGDSIKLNIISIKSKI